MSDLWDEWENSVPDSGEQDPGGYTYLVANDASAFEDVHAKFNSYEFSFLSFHGWSCWRFHVSLPEQVLNCSSIPTYAPMADMYALAAPGALGKYSEFCIPGENCCEGLKGTMQWSGATVVENSADWADIYLERECLEGAMEVEHACMSLSHVGRLICQEYIVSETERLFSIGCHDIAFMSLIQCATYLTADGAFDKNRPLYTDVPAYLRLLSVHELLGLYSMSRSTDAICLPYTYYYPDFTALGPDAEDALPWDTSSPSAASPSAASSSAASPSAASPSAASPSASSVVSTASSGTGQVRWSYVAVVAFVAVGLM